MPAENRPMTSGARVRAERRRRGWDKPEMARRLGRALTGSRPDLDTLISYVKRWEAGKVGISERYRIAYATAFDIPEQDLFAITAALPSGPTRCAVPEAFGELESPLDIGERMQASAATNTSDEVLRRIDDLIELFVDDYEAAGPMAFVPRVARQRRLVDELLSGRQPPRQRQRLYLTAAKLSGLLGYMAVNLGRFPAAKAYCAESFQLGGLLGDEDMQAWARGTASFCAYYMGDFQQSLDLARDGQRYTRNGPQAVRLAINGEARALAKLGDAHGVDEAVSRAYQLADRFEPVPGVSPCISFGPYSQARTTSNAITAYVALRQPKQVREYADEVMPIFESSQSRWSQSLVRLDMATALVGSDRPELEMAGRLAADALTISAERPITSVLTRAREFLTAGSRWQDLPEMAEVAETLRAVERR